MPGRRLICLLLVATLTGACATPVERRLAEAERPLAPAATGGERVFEQLISIRHEEHSRRFIAAGQICDGAMTLALLSPEGLEVLRLRHDEQGVHTRVHRELPDWLDAEAILADIQFVYWPADALEQAWKTTWSLHHDHGGRTLLRQGEAFMRADFEGNPWQDNVRIKHHRLGYELEIRPLHHEAAQSHTDTPCR